MEVVSRVLELLKNKEFTQKGLAQHINITPSNLNTLLRKKENRQFKAIQLPLIADYFNVTIDYLVGKEHLPSKVIPLIGRSSCGIPKEYALDGYEPVPIPEDLFKTGMYAVEADGDSMKPKINDGDIVYCCPNQHIDSGRIVHYWLDGESGIKRYKINEAQTIISLIPINIEDFEIITIHCDEKHELHMAKVVGKIDKDF